MIPKIISSALGFLTLPLIGMAIAGMACTGEWISTLGLPGTNYWIGFFALVGVAILDGCVFGFIES